MTKDTFTYLCQQLAPSVQKQHTRFRQAISIKKRVAITLWFLATTCECRTLSHLFGVVRSTVCEIVLETCKCIVSTLLKSYISFPTGSNGACWSRMQQLLWLLHMGMNMVHVCAHVQHMQHAHAAICTVWWWWWGHGVVVYMWWQYVVLAVLVHTVYLLIFRQGKILRSNVREILAG